MGDDYSVIWIKGAWPCIYYANEEWVDIIEVAPKPCPQHLWVQRRQCHLAQYAIPFRLRIIAINEHKRNTVMITPNSQ